MVVPHKITNRFFIWTSNSGDIYTSMSIVGYFTIVKRSTKGAWINKTRYVHTIEYYSDIKTKGNLIHTIT